MLKYAISAFFVCCFCSIRSNGQAHLSGFYIILNDDKKCLNEFKSSDKSLPSCLSKEPIVSETEFVDVSEIKFNTQQVAKYIELKISKEGYEKLRLLRKKLPNINLVLIVDNTVVGIFDNIGDISNPIPIIGTENSETMNWIHEHLKNKIR